MRSHKCVYKYLLLLGLLTSGFSLINLQTPTVLAQLISKAEADRQGQYNTQIELAKIDYFPRDAYKLLIQPVKDLLPGDPEELVIFVPQGSLFLVTFPALQNGVIGLSRLFLLAGAQSTLVSL